jgi:hypothetical protein
MSGIMDVAGATLTFTAYHLRDAVPDSFQIVQ